MLFHSQMRVYKNKIDVVAVRLVVLLFTVPTWNETICTRILYILSNIASNKRFNIFDLFFFFFFVCCFVRIRQLTNGEKRKSKPQEEEKKLIEIQRKNTSKYILKLTYFRT